MSSPADSVPYPRGQVTGGILAGGRATRMGGVDKGLVDLGGHPMVEYVLNVLRAQTAYVLINANRSLEQYAGYGVPVVQDREDGFLGPLAGIASMMARAETEWLLTSPCDSPLVPSDLGPRLWRAMAPINADIGVAHGNDRLQPVFAMLRCSLLPDLEAYLASGERKVRVWYQRQRMATVDFSDCPDMFLNVNTLAERDELAGRLARAQAL